MDYTLLVDDKTLGITSFTESLDGNGNMTFSVTANNIDMSKSTLTGLRDIREAIANNEIGLKIKDKTGHIVWQSDEYELSNANFNGNESGVYFSAYFYIPTAAAEENASAGPVAAPNA